MGSGAFLDAVENREEKDLMCRADLILRSFDSSVILLISAFC